jgi:hypothetical protein
LTGAVLRAIEIEPEDAVVTRIDDVEIKPVCRGMPVYQDTGGMVDPVPIDRISSCF